MAFKEKIILLNQKVQKDVALEYSPVTQKMTYNILFEDKILFILAWNITFLMT